jgi:hypothetical protein
MSRATMTVLAFTLCAVAATASAGEVQNPGRNDATDAMVGDAAFPAIARDQSRPGRTSTNLEDYIIGVCNCKRECKQSNPYSCRLSTDAAKGCIIEITGGTCEGCIRDCGL